MTEIISLESIAPSNAGGNEASIAQNDFARGSPSTWFPRELDEQAVQSNMEEMSKGRLVVVVGVLFGVTTVGSFSTGLLTVGLPRMAADLEPASVYALSIGCLLILAGSVADLVGSRKIFLLGSFLQGLFVLACALSQTGIQLIIFRAMQGIAVSFCLPTAVSITTTSFPAGKRRNLGLSFMGAGQPIGFLIGSVLGGIFIDTIGWRTGYYMCTAANFLLCVISFWGLPIDRVPQVTWSRFKNDIDWVGALIASTGLGLLSYVLANITGQLSHIRDASTIVPLSVSLASLPAFIIWVGRQEKRNKPALIPNSLWKNSTFVSICITVLLSWAVLNGMELFCSLFFQDVQQLSALDTSLRFIPNIISGAILNIGIGFLIHRFRVDYLVFISSFIAAVSPLLMALTNPAWPYWYTVFWVMLLGPFSADVLFTVAALLITDVFPEKTQALGGAVFQTVAQFGNSVGLAIMANISTSVTNHSDYKNKTSSAALLEGYRITFWVSFVWMILATIIGGLGLRRAGKVGLKRE
ncbi:MAG: hypothetical protein Q9214_002394 [Letrouitia sp. 1 TL-2023]